MENDTAAERPLILLVDDDELILELLTATLEHGNCTVHQAASAEQALADLPALGRKPDLAVLDIYLPGMSGLDLARRLQEHAGIPSLFLSASHDDALTDRAAEHGAVGYLVKPVSPASVMPTVKAALARADELRLLRETEARLTQALHEGRETGIVVGMLMERFRTDRHTAFETLRDHARAQRRKLNDVAREMLLAEEGLHAALARTRQRD